MEAIANELRLRMGANFTLCVQGEAPKSELLDRFKSMPNAVLVGSMSFCSENDFGVIVFGDNRLLQKRYGRVVLESLPAMIRTQEFARVFSFLDNPDEAY